MVFDGDIDAIAARVHANVDNASALRSINSIQEEIDQRLLQMIGIDGRFAVCAFGQSNQDSAFSRVGLDQSDRSFDNRQYRPLFDCAFLVGAKREQASQESIKPINFTRHHLHLVVHGWVAFQPARDDSNRQANAIEGIPDFVRNARYYPSHCSQAILTAQFTFELLPVISHLVNGLNNGTKLRVLVWNAMIWVDFQALQSGANRSETILQAEAQSEYGAD